MKKVTLTTSTTSYDILAGAGLLGKTGKLLRDKGLTGSKAVIVSDERIYPLHGATLKQGLETEGFNVLEIIIPQGEDRKTLETAGRLYNLLTDFFAERTTPILALGGGVIGDLAGFVAATYMRGVPLVQVPTTLLSMGDSSIGGKTAVNHGRLKNKVGVFYHPLMTISDVSVLKTLTPRELSNGLSEIIKHSVILDKEFFVFLDEYMDDIKEIDEDVLETVVSRSAAIKAYVVQQDELDLGLRNILNCGHTVGHAIESVSGLKVWHGEAVAMGLLAEARISSVLGLISKGDVQKIASLLEAAELPVRLPNLDPVKLLEAMKHDKKVTDGKIRFALPRKIGEAIITDEVENAVIERALRN